MTALYITSLEEGSGKTAVGAGLGKHLLRDNKKVGFFKPIIAEGKNPPKAGADSDAAFIKHLFALEEPVELLCPVFSDSRDLSTKVKEAYAKVAQGKDVVIVEGISEQYQAARSIAEALGAKVIIVESYSKELLKAVSSYQDFGEYLLGILLNKVPKSQTGRVRAEISAHFGEKKINILGVIPEDRTLFTLTIGELAEHIKGEILRGAEKSAEPVGNFMLGAHSIDPGPDYFGRKDNKAVVLSNERPDMQLAALETPTRCLVLSGNQPLMPIVLERAEEKDVPIILAKDDVTTIAANIEDALGKTKFNQESKLPKLTEIMEQNFDFKTVYRDLGLAA